VAYGRRRRRKSRFLSRFIILLLIVGGGYYGYTKYYKKQPAPAPADSTTQPSASPMTPPGGVVQTPPLTPPLEGLTAEPAGSQPTSQPVATRPSNGGIQPFVMEPIAVPPPEQVETVYQEGMKAFESGDLLKARDALNRVLHASIPADRQKQIRETLSQIAEKTIFAPFTLVPGETMAEDYVVVQGDNLQKIGKNYLVTEDLLSVVNGDMNKNVIRTGRRLKVVKGPFHATVVKSAFDLHVYLQNVYVRTYKVALGADNSTPTGKWVVTTGLRNPTWTNPRTGQKIKADDPQNPLGEFWIALDGIEGRARGQSGYGIHGTIDESSIGTEASMGCVRLANKDIEALYSMLVPGSTVTIVD
jgi:LysM repeat protein